jgi:redox-sensitive bicupin YhaK (pirin superfamily)
MLLVRRAAERGHTELDWLNSWHTFSFDQYFDPDFVNFGPLRVINEDIVAPRGGFPMHPHRDMEIITYILDGQLEHQDSLGNGSVIQPGEIQKMSAGTGIVHSEFNPSAEHPVHLLQIWIMANRKGLTPSYEQRPLAVPANSLQLIGSDGADGGNGVISISQDVQLFAFRLQDSGIVEHKIPQGKVAWIQVAKGTLSANGESLTAGDGLGASDTEVIQLKGAPDAEGLLFIMSKQ